MIQHFTKTDYTVMPWANGKGETTEIYRRDQDGHLHWRISMAAVVKDGPFSHFQDTLRSLTVISGKGFDLVEETRRFRADPLKPVSFSGEVPITAENVLGKCNDFNVMWNFGLPRPDVYVLENQRQIIQPHEGQVAIFAVKSSQIKGYKLKRHDMILTNEPVEFIKGTIICVGMEFY